jgi:hypothetical protein
VESFAGGDDGPAPRPNSRGRSGRFLRFNTAALYLSLNAERERRGMTLDQVAVQLAGRPGRGNHLKRLANGGRSDVSSALAICEWLGSTIHSFQYETML